MVGASGRSCDLTVVIWEGAPVAFLDNRLVAALGPTCRVEIGGEGGGPQILAFDILPEPEAGFLRLAPSGIAPLQPHLLWRRRGGGVAGQAEALVIGAPDDRTARDWLLAQPGLADPGRMSPWRHGEPRSGIRPLDEAAADWRDYFDAEFYLAGNPDLVAARVDPFAHFAAAGESEGRMPVRDLPRHFLTADPQNPGFAALVAAGRRWLLPAELQPTQPVASALPPVTSAAAAVESVIDADFYAAQVPDRRLPNARSAARHYLRQGHALGLDPVPWFSETAYLRDNPDVVQAGIAGFAHYLLHGAQEGRRIQPSGRISRAVAARRPLPADLLRLQPRLDAVLTGRRA